MRKVIVLGFSLLISCLTQAKVKVGVLYASGASATSTSNGIEKHIQKGILLFQEQNSKKLKNFEFEWIDIGESAEEAVKALPKLKKKKYNYIVGANHSFQALIILDFLQKNKLEKTKLVTPAATSDELLKYENIFMVSNSNSIQASLLVSEIKKENISSKEVMVVSLKNCQYCQNFAYYIKNELKKNRLPSFHIEVSGNSAKFSKKDLQKKYDHIVILAHELKTAEIINSIFFSNKDSSFWAGDGVGTLARYVKRLKFSKEINFKFLSHYHPEIKTRENKTFIKHYKRKFNSVPIDTSAFFYEAMRYILSQEAESKEELLSVTGKLEVFKKQTKRSMPLLKLQNSEVVFDKLLRPK